MPARLAHLGMIQGIISRLAGFSANAKNLSITVVAAIAGISYQQRLPILFFAAGIVIVLFAALDTYYLAQERRFRSHYKVVVDRPLADAKKLVLDPTTLTLAQYLAATRSFSTGGFYLLLLIVTGVILPSAHERSDFNGLGNLSRTARAPESERVGEPSNVASTRRISGSAPQASAPVSLPNPELVEPRSAPPTAFNPFGTRSPALAPTNSAPRMFATPKERSTFYSFHYRDVFRVNHIRKAGMIQPHDKERRQTPRDRSLWEKRETQSPAALPFMINRALAGTTVTALLAGYETWRREWVRYEIARSLMRGNGLLTVFIDGCECPRERLGSAWFQSAELHGSWMEPPDLRTERLG